MSFWTDKIVLVTGGAGFIGSHVVELLIEKGARVRVTDNLENGTLRNLHKVSDRIEFVNADLRNVNECERVSRETKVVMHLAAKVGGITYNMKHPGTMFRDNILINTNVLEMARVNNVERFLMVSSACVYQRFCKVPTPETEGFVGVPEDTNMGYGWAKRMGEVQAEAYAKEFGMKIAIVRPYNTYGPKDHFEPERSHVIPALIKRIYDGENPLTVWGDGEQTRAFLYVTDLARGMVEATEKYPCADALNLGTDEEIKMKDLVEMIISLSGENPTVHFDTTKPSGQPRRNCDTSKAKEKIGFEAQVRLKDGLRKQIEWYRTEALTQKTL
ncbi:MAG: SDR family NAD(P)-dependent oxidoreductase [Candidatus Brocadiales bacterium]